MATKLEMFKLEIRNVWIGNGRMRNMRFEWQLSATVTSGLVQKRKKLVELQAVSSVSKVSSNPTKCVASVYLLQIARENDPCKSGRKLVAYAIPLCLNHLCAHKGKILRQLNLLVGTYPLP